MHSSRQTFYRSLVVASTLLLAISLYAQPEILPNRSSASSDRNDVDPAADVVLHRMETAYRNLKSAEMRGRVEINLEFPGTSENTNQAFKSSFQAPNKFKHEMTNGLMLGSDGDKGFVYDQKAQSYARFDFPMEKLPVENLPPLVPHILQVRNPSLLFAISKEPFSELARNFDEVKKLNDVRVNGTNYTALRFGSGKGSGQITMLVDQNTQLIRRFTVDFKPALEEAGKRSVDSAMLLVDYASVRPNASINENQFDWTPPEESIDIHEAAGASRPEKEKPIQLEGTVAPNFTLTSIDQKVISLYDLRGKVVVLDFWASWCPPCVASLPKLMKVAKDERNSSVAFFTINVGEERETVEGFLKKQKLSPTVLLDENGNVSKLFGIQMIPQTIVIGKDGIIKKTLLDGVEGLEAELQQAVDDASKSTKK